MIRSKDNEMYEAIKEVIVNATAEGADIKWGGGYKTKEVLLIDENLEDELQYYYTFLRYGDEDKKEVFSLSEPIELEDEENVIMVLTDSFFDESKI